MKGLGLVALMVAAGCSDPALHAGVGYSAAGLSVRPAASADLGGFRVSVTP